MSEQGTPKALRPIGLCTGQFVVPDDFDNPLPEEILRDFEGGSEPYFEGLRGCLPLTKVQAEELEWRLEQLETNPQPRFSLAEVHQRMLNSRRKPEANN